MSTHQDFPKCLAQTLANQVLADVIQNQETTTGTKIAVRLHEKNSELAV